ncbi:MULTISPECIES: nucleoside 2-deoxyribosyltransferase [unclassified Mycoplasma]|uniref:nucleoside 2-deoxyribosyltransferase n=1 Tax=unclassified Mycoplasma TaxID=2683645 RepID=UPI00216AF070|nr:MULTISPECIES: nucleoside 2-deoxyribosyltransferase [unclassified Mycoplasma]MCS4536567.1 nucleoside 2-deoxyribosyltransferase [Mycoplasma sp. CSL7475-4]MCT4469614.1 nucleoside 2-deoxyribosyltransferase [Mycoplasma sp. HS2188]
MKKIYFANALFSQAELAFNEQVVKRIRELGKYEVYLPQENFSINDKTKVADSEKIYLADKKELEDSQIIVAVLDGLVIDPGVAAEIGMAAQRGMKIYGLITDSRRTGYLQRNDARLDLICNSKAESQFMYFNLFVIGAVKANGHLFDNVDDLIKELDK